MNSGIIGAPYYGGAVVRRDAVTHVISVESVIDYISPNNGNPGDYDGDFIGTLIDSVWSALERAIGEPIARNGAYRWTFTGREKRTHTPALARVNGIVSLAFWNESTRSWEPIPEAAYYGDDTSGVWQIWYPDAFIREVRYRATLDVGFDPLPDDIREYLLDAVVERYYDSVKGHDRFELTADSQTVSGVTYSKLYDRGALRARRRELVRRYMRVGV
jgi:hypothetical protein